MTKELYWKNAYQKNAPATVQSVNNEKFVVLDQSIFYPNGGGQPTDTGKLSHNNEEFNVVFAKKMGKDISLEVDKPGLKEGDSIESKLNWERRFALMRMHTSSHVLAKIIFNETGSLITGNQLETEKSRMDFNVSEFNREISENYIQKANEIIKQNISVSVEFLEREKALQKPDLVRLKDIMPPNLKTWRVVSIGDFDVQADGGTHVKNTSEIGTLKLLKTENKGTENRRIYWNLEP
ncbi:alanyl-tRNA editing protein [Candidatus Micrarchaeota archaeon]|nr:alanyl-tRNA editing protein [Candidatus Micrarchaeota archaeon]MBU1931053.1 alanyl-tRNA editing protein [Candidatus Micrarchaeota archaeon]